MKLTTTVLIFALAASASAQQKPADQPVPVKPGTIQLKPAPAKPAVAAKPQLAKPAQIAKKVPPKKAAPKPKKSSKPYCDSAASRRLWKVSADLVSPTTDSRD